MRWKGQSLQITSDFSDRKLGENLRKLLSGPTHTTELACAAAGKINTAFRCTSTMTQVFASAPFLISYSMARCMLKKNCIQEVCALGTWQNRGITTRCIFNMCKWNTWAAFTTPWQTESSINQSAAHQKFFSVCSQTLEQFSIKPPLGLKEEKLALFLHVSASAQKGSSLSSFIVGPSCCSWKAATMLHWGHV